jgi:hypothetical protein
MMNNNRPLNQQDYFKFLQGQQNKSFVQAIYDEMGDALYKTDPHVAGLIISRIYMDKFVR